LGIVPEVLRMGTFWVLLVLHVGAWVAHRYGYPPKCGEDRTEASLSEHMLNIMTVMTVFFEVFITSLIYTRYDRMYRSIRTMFTAITHMAMDIRIHDEDKHLDLVRLAARYLLASVVLWCRDPTSSVLEMREQHFEEAVQIGALQPEELQYLEGLSLKHCSGIVGLWSARVVFELCHTIHMPPQVTKGLLLKHASIRAVQQELSFTHDLLIPFPYFHLLTLMVPLNLLMFSYTFGCSTSVFSPICFFCLELVFLGMLRAALMLNDVFVDNEDLHFPMKLWVSQMVEDVMFILDLQEGVPESAGDNAGGTRQPQAPDQSPSTRRLTAINPEALESMLRRRHSFTTGDDDDDGDD